MSVQSAKNPATDASAKGFLPRWGIVLGVVIIILLAVIPLAINRESEFGGADGAAADTVGIIDPDYNSEWIVPLWAPPGTETESLIFALQAAIGTAVIAYAFGYFHGRKRPAVPGKKK